MSSENIGYAMIGTPDGLQMQVRGILENRRIGGIVDLPNRMIKLIHQRDEILSVVKEFDGKDIFTYFILHRYALEIERNRTGAFYGGVIALKNCKAPGLSIYPALVEIVSRLETSTYPDTGKFSKTLDKILFRDSYHLPFLVNATNQFRLTIPFEKGKSCFISARRSIDIRLAFLEAAINDKTLATYESIYLSEDAGVADYVREQQGLTIFTQQEEKEPGILPFGITNERTDFQFNVKPKVDLLEEIGSLNSQVYTLREKVNRLEQEKAELSKSQEQLKSKDPARRPVGETESPPLQASPQGSTSGTSSPPLPRQNSINQANRDQRSEELGSRRGVSSFFSRMWGRFRRLLKFLPLALLIILAILIAILTILEKDIPFISNSPITQEQQEPPREIVTASSEKPSRETQPQTTPQETQSLSEEQEKVWEKVKGYLDEIGGNLKYDQGTMDQYMRQMQQLEMEGAPQYQSFQRVYNNYMGSNMPLSTFRDLKSSFFRPSNKRTELGIIATDDLTVQKLASYILEQCPEIQNTFNRTALENVIINANPNDVNRVTKTVEQSKNIMFYVPNTSTCNLNQ